MHEKNDRTRDASLQAVDGELLDRLVDSDFDADMLEGLSAAARRRVDSLSRLFNLLEDYPVGDDAFDPADDVLIDATLARIQQFEDSRSARLSFASAREAGGDGARSRWRIRMPDFISVAAVILIAVGILWPVLGEMRQRSIDAGCVANLAALGGAFETYARDFTGRIPVQTAGWGVQPEQAPTWVDPAVLVQGGYCSEGHLNCPGHAHLAEPGYSRQLFIVGGQIRWHVQGARPVMGDRNPLLDPMLRPDVRTLDPKTNSNNHGKRGQNVMSSDGSVNWLDNPFMGSDDNIWLPRGKDRPTRDFVPDLEGDIYLVQ